ncbi:MAG TPA: hypothetical protein VJ184_00295 [Chryseolinea sp.]|nr:hypothetical protein [Chryseolinea sp.]
MIIEFTLGTLVNLCLLITSKAVEEKKVYMLLKSVIFHYHGLDDEEKKDLDKTANDLAAHEEYKWALDFVAQDYITAFDRARNYLNDIIGDYQKEKRVELINMVWQANNVKGYVTEMEATAMLKLAKDWNVQKELVELVLD